MKKIDNIKKLNDYILRYNINNIFSIDMKPYMELFLFMKNEYICKEDEKIEYLFFFVEGKAKIYTLLNNGKALLLCFNKPFRVIGEVEVMNHDAACTNVQAIEDTYCVGISFENIRKYAINDSKFLRFICEGLGTKLNRVTKYSSINLLYPLENRLASYLLAISYSNPNYKEKIITFDGNLTEMSELLGTSYRHLLRTLNKLCNEGAIRKNKEHYDILDINLLEKLAGELYE